MLHLPEATSALDYARHFEQLPIQEGPIKNRSREIDELGRLIGYPAPRDPKATGLPYCAIGVCACFLLYFQQHEGQGREFSRTASSQAIRRYFEAKGWLSRDAQALADWQGALFGWTNADGAHGHVGFVAGRLTDGAGRVVGVKTIEFNSDLSGDRDGDGCYALYRRKLLSGPNKGLWQVENKQRKLVGPARQLWFCDVSKFKGGDWW